MINPSGLKKYVKAGASVTSQNPVFGIWDPPSYLLSSSTTERGDFTP